MQGVNHRPKSVPNAPPCQRLKTADWISQSASSTAPSLVFKAAATFIGGGRGCFAN